LVRPEGTKVDVKVSDICLGAGSRRRRFLVGTGDSWDIHDTHFW